MSADERKDKYRVLVVDDVAEHRRHIVDMLLSDPKLHVVGLADNGATALKLMPILKPDVATVDLAMPRMDGFTFLRLLMAYAPLPVVLVTAQQQHSQMLAALDAGAVDFVMKPGLFALTNLGRVREELVQKVLAAAAVRATPIRRQPHIPPFSVAGATPPVSRDTPAQRVVCVGASTGGPRMLHVLVKSVPPTGNTALFIAQHMPENFTASFAQRLDRLSQWNVQEATDGMTVLANGCYVAPGGSHLQLVRDGGTVRCEVVKATPSDEYVPSVDRMFSAAATLFRQECMAVVLTGMGTDGSLGVRRMREQGGLVLVEDPRHAVVDRMPKEAIRTGCVDAALTFAELITQIQVFCQQGARGVTLNG